MFRILSLEYSAYVGGKIFLTPWSRTKCRVSGWELFITSENQIHCSIPVNLFHKDSVTEIHVLLSFLAAIWSHHKIRFTVFQHSQTPGKRYVVKNWLDSNSYGEFFSGIKIDAGKILIVDDNSKRRCVVADYPDQLFARNRWRKGTQQQCQNGCERCLKKNISRNKLILRDEVSTYHDYLSREIQR